jgi:hypothetical protein
LIAADGDAAVLHRGRQPYLISPSGELKLARANLDAQAIERLATFLLPEGARQALRATNLVESECPRLPEWPAERFSVLAASLADGLSLEVRRYRVHPRPMTAPGVTESEHQAVEFDDSVPEEFLPPLVASHRQEDDDLAVPSAEELWSAP